MISVERVENEDRWMQFAQHRTVLQTSIRKGKVIAPVTIITAGKAELAAENGLLAALNETYLFHGTKWEFADTIAMREGFDERTASLAGLYGAGVYGADEACKSASYIDRNQQGQSCMLLCFYGAVRSCNRFLWPGHVITLSRKRGSTRRRP